MGAAQKRSNSHALLKRRHMFQHVKSFIPVSTGFAKEACGAGFALHGRAKCQRQLAGCFVEKVVGAAWVAVQREVAQAVLRSIVYFLVDYVMELSPPLSSLPLK